MNRPGGRIFWGGLVALLPSVASAQALLHAEASQSVHGSQAYGLNSAEGESFTAPILTNQSVLRLSALSSRPKLSLAGDLRMVAGLDTSALSAYDPTAEESGTVTSLRLQPELTLGLTARPLERSQFGVMNRVSVFRVQQGDSLYDATFQDPTTDYSNPTTGTTDGGIPSADPTSLSGGYSILSQQPRNSWINESQATIVRATGEQWRQDVIGTYRVYRQFECEPTVTLEDGRVFKPRNYATDTAVVRPGLGYQTSQAQRFGSSVMFMRADNRPMTECMDPDPVDPSKVDYGHVYYQLNPMLSYGWGAAPLTFSIDFGGTVVLSRRYSLEGDLGGIEGFDPRPVGQVNLARAFPWGDVKGKAGVQVATLLGQPAPTYNVLAETTVHWRRSERWGVRGGVSFLQAFLLNERYLLAGLESATGSTMVLGQTVFEWRPTRWFIGQAGYTLAWQSNRLADNQAVVDAPIGQYDRLLLNTLSLTASFTLDRGLSEALLPKVASRP